MNTTHSSSLAVEVPAYAQLQRKMHDPRKARPEGSQFPRTGCRRRRSGDALRAQHPDWILPNGDCPTCDSYDARFAELLIQTLPTRPRRPKQCNTHQSQYKFQYPSCVTTTQYIQ